MNDFFCLKPSLILFITIFIYFINYYAKDIKKNLLIRISLIIFIFLAISYIIFLVMI